MIKKNNEHEHGYSIQCIFPAPIILPGVIRTLSLFLSSLQAVAFSQGRKWWQEASFCLFFFPERKTIAVPKQHDVEIADFFLLFLKSAWGFFWYIFFLTLLCSFYLVCNSTLCLNDLYKKNLTYVVYLFSLYTSATYKPVLPVAKVYI